MNPPRRPVNDALLSTVMYMIQECLGINNNITGKTYEMVEAEARDKLYTMLDTIAGPPRYDNPAPPPEPDELKRLRIKDRMLRWMVTQPGTDMHTLVKAIEGAYVTTSPTEPDNLEVEYLALYKDLDAIRAVLGITPYPDKGLNTREVYNEVVALVGRCKALKAAIIPTPYDPYDPHRPFGVDYNGLAYLINSLVKP